MRDAIVVGGGIIGATVAKSLEAQGRDVLCLDRREEMAGTPPSGGHLKPSWFGGMKKSEYEPAMELLSDTWGLIEEKFRLRPTLASATVYRVDTDVVLRYPTHTGTVFNLEYQSKTPEVFWDAEGKQRSEKCKLLVVATGFWAAELIEHLEITPKRGVSFRFEGKIKRPFIKPWAPYKQVVAHQQSGNEVWIGDGSAILPANWDSERTSQCLARCTKTLTMDLKVPKMTRQIHGIRAYVKTKGLCHFEKIGPSAYVATGAGKSGTIAAGWVARRILDATS